MANRAALLDILNDEFSSPAQKNQAKAGLLKLDHPESIAVNLTAEPTATQPIAEPAKEPNVPLDRVGFIFSGIDYLDDPAGFEKADAAARLRCPEFDGAKYRAQQRQWSSDACACTRANQQDSDNRMAIIQVEHPGWDIIQVHKEYAAQDESHTRFQMVDGVVQKLRYDKTWTTFEVVPIAVAPLVKPRPVNTAPVATKTLDETPNYDPLAGHLAQRPENAEKAKRLAERADTQILEAQRISRERLSPSTAQDL